MPGQISTDGAELLGAFCEYRMHQEQSKRLLSGLPWNPSGSSACVPQEKANSSQLKDIARERAEEWTGYGFHMCQSLPPKGMIRQAKLANQLAQSMEKKHG